MIYHSFFIKHRWCKHKALTFTDHVYKAFTSQYIETKEKATWNIVTTVQNDCA